MKNSKIAATIALVLSATLTTACATKSTENNQNASDKINVIAALYPLEFVAQEVGGDHINISNLTPPNAEAHDLEISPAQGRRMSEADLVLFLPDLQPAVDDAITARNLENTLNAADFIDLMSTETDEAEEHDDHEHAGEDHDHGIYDPHFWLDPTQLSEYSQAVANELSKIDPTNQSEYQANAKALQTKLTELDAKFDSTLKTCQQREFVTSHAAFNYLAQRYELTQVSISGIDPDTEPSPAALKKVKELIKEKNITTIFFESSSSKKVTDVLASDLGIKTASLNPLESLAKKDQNYFSVMESNLTSLQSGLQCQ